VPVQVRLQPATEAGFFTRLPAAFAYPVRGSGVMVMALLVLLLMAFRWGQALVVSGSIRFILIGLLMEIVSTGYMFAFLQGIIHATAAGEREMPDMPSVSSFFDDILVPFLKVLGVTVFCFGPALALLIWGATHRDTWSMVNALAAAFVGGLYAPMAFLAVAVLDSVGAANPLVVVPAIVKVPLEYVLTLVLLGATCALFIGESIVLDSLFPERMLTHSMGKLVGLLGLSTLWNFLNLYIVIAGVHVLGLLFVTKKEKLGWFEH